MNHSNLSDLVARGDERTLLLALLHEVYQLQRDLLDVRRALGITRPDEAPGTVEMPGAASGEPPGKGEMPGAPGAASGEPPGKGEMLGAPGAASSEAPADTIEDWSGDDPLF